MLRYLYLGDDIMPDKKYESFSDSIKEDEKVREDLLRETEKRLTEHNEKLLEFEHKAKNLELLEIKYNSLEKEVNNTLKNNDFLIKEQKEQIANLESELSILRRTILNYKNQVTNLKSIIELTVKDFGLSQISLATGISEEKIKEYLQD